jgi:hypothetical protein
VSDRIVSDVTTEEDICTLVTTILARGGGGTSARSMPHLS